MRITPQQRNATGIPGDGRPKIGNSLTGFREYAYVRRFFAFITMFQAIASRLLTYEHGGCPSKDIGESPVERNVPFKNRSEGYFAPQAANLRPGAAFTPE